MALFTDCSLQPVLFMVPFMELFIVHDREQPLLPGLLLAFDIWLNAFSSAAPAGSAVTLSCDW